MALALDMWMRFWEGVDSVMWYFSTFLFIPRNFPHEIERSALSDEKLRLNWMSEGQYAPTKKKKRVNFSRYLFIETTTYSLHELFFLFSINHKFYTSFTNLLSLFSPSEHRKKGMEICWSEEQSLPVSFVKFYKSQSLDNIIKTNDRVGRRKCN